jgi:hypothetical protein
MSVNALGFLRSRLGVAVLVLAAIALVPMASAQTKPGTGAIQVTVTDPDGKPVEGVTITMESGHHPPSSAIPPSGAQGKTSSGDGHRDLAAEVLLGQQFILKTDKDGVATFKDLEPGKYRLRIDETEKYQLVFQPAKAEVGKTVKIAIKLMPK